MVPSSAQEKNAHKADTADLVSPRPLLSALFFHLAENVSLIGEDGRRPWGRNDCLRCVVTSASENAPTPEVQFERAMRRSYILAVQLRLFPASLLDAPARWLDIDRLLHVAHRHLKN
jgi:hypothetical protein